MFDMIKEMFATEKNPEKPLVFPTVLKKNVLKQTVKTETLFLVKYVLIFDAALIVLTMLLGYFDLSMFLGLVVGSTYTVLNFIFIGFSIGKALNGFPEHANVVMGGLYCLRYFITAVVILIGLTSVHINIFGLLIPLIFPKVIFLIGSVQK